MFLKWSENVTYDPIVLSSRNSGLIWEEASCHAAVKHIVRAKNERSFWPSRFSLSLSLSDGHLSLSLSLSLSLASVPSFLPAAKPRRGEFRIHERPVAQGVLRPVAREYETRLKYYLKTRGSGDVFLQDFDIMVISLVNFVFVYGLCPLMQG